LSLSLCLACLPLLTLPPLFQVKGNVLCAQCVETISSVDIFSLFVTIPLSFSISYPLILLSLSFFLPLSCIYLSLSLFLSLPPSLFLSLSGCAFLTYCAHKTF